MKVREVVENNSATKICIMTDKGEGIFCGSWYNYYHKNYAKMRAIIGACDVVGFSNNCGDTLFVLVKEMEI